MLAAKYERDTRPAPWLPGAPSDDNSSRSPSPTGEQDDEFAQYAARVRAATTRTARRWLQKARNRIAPPPKPRAITSARV